MFFCIQYRIPHTRTSVAPPWSKVSYAGPKISNGALPKWQNNASSIMLTKNQESTYAAIEFTPTTTSGNAGFFQPRISTRYRNAASIQKQIPPLNSTQLGVQMRLTTGQIPS